MYYYYYFSRAVDNNRRCREDKQVSQSIIWSPSALSVEQPVSSRALKISLISSERTADTWNITHEKKKKMIIFMWSCLSCDYVGVLFVWICVQVNSIKQSPRLQSVCKVVCWRRCHSTCDPPRSSDCWKALMGTMVALYLIHEVWIVNEIISAIAQRWERMNKVLHFKSLFTLALLTVVH